MLKTINYINEALSYGKLLLEILHTMKEELGISYREYDGGVHYLLDYSQIDSPRSSEIVRECRSLIIKYDFETNQVSVASMKFPRFFNHGEMLDYYEDFKINSDMTLASKEDGSIIGLWYNSEMFQWDISTRGMAKAEGNHPMGGTFRDAVLRAMNLTEDQFQSHAAFLNETHTYVMELVGPLNRCVRPYQKDELVLLDVFSAVVPGWGLASSKAWNENYVARLNRYGIPCRSPEYFDVPGSFEEIQAMANSLPGLEEGFVLFDPVSNKLMKFKSRAYCVAHDVRGDNTMPTPKHVYSLVLANEHHEFLCYFPEYQQLFDAAQEKVSKFVLEMVELFWKNESVENQKEFAVAVKDSPGKSYMFIARREGKPLTSVWNETKIEQRLKHFL